MSSVQVSRRLPRSGLRNVVETNLRVVETDGYPIMVQRVRIESSDRCPDLRQKVCSRLRGDGRVAVPSPWDVQELIMVPAEQRLRSETGGDGWHVKLMPDDRRMQLDLEKSCEAAAAAELLQKALVVAFEHSGDYWWLSESARYWYQDAPAPSEDGIVLIPRLSFATTLLGNGRLGVAFHAGHLLRTEQTVAELLTQNGSRLRFERLRKRDDGRRGTLIYNTGKPRRLKCYFHDFADELTCGSSGVISFGSERYASLLEYYRRKYPVLKVMPDDSVVSVSFEWGKRPVLVAAKLLHMRLRLDAEQLPPSLRRTSMSPNQRRSFVQNQWTPRTEAAVLRSGGQLAHGLWRPSASDSEQLRPPGLLFGGGMVLRPPREETLEEYKWYFRKRERILRKHGAYRFEATVARDIWIAVPPTRNGWTQELQDEFVRCVRDDLGQITKQRFRLRIVTAPCAKDVPSRLPANDPATCLVMFDEHECDGASYYLLSETLRHWRLKRVTRGELQAAWKWRRRATGKEKAQAERRWRDVVFHTVLDLLDQMGCVPWRIDDWPYQACLAIDVPQERRFCSVSFLLCRDAAKHSGCDGFWRYVESWTKADTKRETIDAVRLEDKIVGIVEEFPGSRLTPVESVLVLRDGRECGDELEAIRNGLQRWMKQGALSQSATIDLVDYHKRTVKDMRMWMVGEGQVSNVLEGRAVYVDGAALVCATGAGTLGEKATAEPCLLVGRDGADIRPAAQAIFALSQHNYLSPKRAYRDAQPMRDADHELKRRMAMEVRLR